MEFDFCSQLFHALWSLSCSLCDVWNGISRNTCIYAMHKHVHLHYSLDYSYTIPRIDYICFSY